MIQGALYFNSSEISKQIGFVIYFIHYLNIIKAQSMINCLAISVVQQETSMDYFNIPIKWEQFLHSAEIWPRETPKKCLRKSAEYLNKEHIFRCHLTTTLMEDLFKGCQLLLHKSSFLIHSHQKQARNHVVTCLTQYPLSRAEEWCWNCPKMVKFSVKNYHSQCYVTLP